MQHKVRKKIPVLMLILKGVYSWNKMWSLKSLAMLKFERRTSLYMQYNIVTFRLCSDV